MQPNPWLEGFLVVSRLSPTLHVDEFSKRNACKRVEKAMHLQHLARRFRRFSPAKLDFSIEPVIRAVPCSGSSCRRRRVSQKKNVQKQKINIWNLPLGAFGSNLHPQKSIYWFDGLRVGGAAAANFVQVANNGRPNITP